MASLVPAQTRPVSSGVLGALLFLGAVWGASFLFLRVAAPEVGAVWAAEIRIALGAAILALVFGRRTLAAVRGRLIGFVIVGALFAALPFTLISFATLTLPAGFTALLNAATPLFTVAVGVAFLGQRLLPRLAVGLAVGIAAVVVLVGWSPLAASPATLFAVAAGLGAPLSYAIAGNYVRAKLSDVGPIELSTGMLVSGSLVALPMALLSGPPRMPELDGAVSLLAVGTLSTALAWPIFFRVLRGTTPTTASTVTFIVPAFAMAWGALILTEPVGLNLLTGFGLILVSLLLVLGIRPRVPSPVTLRTVLRLPAAAAASVFRFG